MHEGKYILNKNTLWFVYCPVPMCIEQLYIKLTTGYSRIKFGSIILNNNVILMKGLKWYAFINVLSFLFYQIPSTNIVPSHFSLLIFIFVQQILLH